MSQIARRDDSVGGLDPNSTLKVLLYSDDRATRDEVRLAVGRRPGKGAPIIEWFDAATEFGVYDLLKQHTFDLLILDGEAAKVGGMGLARQLRDEIENVPPMLLLIARPQDEWLGRWSTAEAMVSFPVDPKDIQHKVLALVGAQAR